MHFSVSFKQGSIPPKNVVENTHIMHIHTIYKNVLHDVVLLLYANSNNKKIVILYTFLICYVWALCSMDRIPDRYHTTILILGPKFRLRALKTHFHLFDP
jgi:hypothetical protein